MDDGEVSSKPFLEIDRNDLIVTLAKLAVIRWDTLCWLRGGAMQGVNHGTLSPACYKQYLEAEAIMATVLKSDPTILSPGFYSKERFHIFSQFRQMASSYNCLTHIMITVSVINVE